MILYEDKEILVCHKLAGIPVQSASVREKDMVSILRNHLGDDVYVVHRLDQPVEGVLVFAKKQKFRRQTEPPDHRWQYAKNISGSGRSTATGRFRNKIGIRSNQKR